jgi:hypothetical protein
LGRRADGLPRVRHHRRRLGQQPLFSSDDGFASADPLAGPSSILFTGEATDSGPEDHGALFDFGFGTVAPSATQSFKIFYGAAATETEALGALGLVGAEVFSLGQSSTPDGPTLGSPTTFIFGFTGVGGDPILPTVTPTATGTSTATAVSTGTATSTATATNTAVATASNTAVPTSTNTAVPTATNTPAVGTCPDGADGFPECNPQIDAEVNLDIDCVTTNPDGSFTVSARPRSPTNRARPGHPAHLGDRADRRRRGSLLGKVILDDETLSIPFELTLPAGTDPDAELSV